MWEWTIKKAESRRIDAFELWCWRGLLRVPWMTRRSNEPILKEISPEYPLEVLMLKLKLQYFGHLLWRTDSFEKTLMLGKIEGRRSQRQRMRWLDASLPGAGERHSTRDKGHEEGGSAYAKAGSSLGSAPQKTRVCLLYCFVLSPLTLLGAVPHHHLTLSVKELTYSSN